MTKELFQMLRRFVEAIERMARSFETIATIMEGFVGAYTEAGSTLDNPHVRKPYIPMIYVTLASENPLEVQASLAMGKNNYPIRIKHEGDK